MPETFGIVVKCFRCKDVSDCKVLHVTLQSDKRLVVWVHGVQVLRSGYGVQGSRYPREVLAHV
jgi:hypothetical protein